MSELRFIYVYDALCSWCYGFDSVLLEVQRQYEGQISFELVSGGMNIGERRRPIKSVLANFRAAYRNVIQATGADISEAYLGGLVERDNYVIDSERPAIALSVFRSDPARQAQQLAFVATLQTGMYRDGLNPNEAAYYRQAVTTFGLDPDAFLLSMQEERFRNEAHRDFELTQELEVNGFPHLFLRDTSGQYHLVSPGYSTLASLLPRIEAALATLTA